jgi:hypothetical protein
MLPFILGGIALTAVGYGIKEICESEGCPWDEPSTTTEQTSRDIWVLIETHKRELHEELLPRLKASLSQTKREEPWSFTQPQTPLYERLPIESMADDIELYGELYLDLLEHIIQSTNYISDVIEEQTIHYKSYKNWTKEYKQIAKTGYKLYKKAQMILDIQLIKNSELNIEIIAPLKGYKKELESLGIY